MTIRTAATAEASESKLFVAGNFALESGEVLPELVLAYETYGTLAPGGRIAVRRQHCVAPIWRQGPIGFIRELYLGQDDTTLKLKVPCSE